MDGTNQGPNVSTTSIMAMGCRQYLPHIVVQLKDRKSHRRNGVVDTFGQKLSVEAKSTEIWEF